MTFERCTAAPTEAKFFHIAGVVEFIRQENRSRTHEPLECDTCGGWHAVPREVKAA
jgi:hypothetical protein